MKGKLCGKQEYLMRISTEGSTYGEFATMTMSDHHFKLPICLNRPTKWVVFGRWRIIQLQISILLVVVSRVGIFFCPHPYTHSIIGMLLPQLFCKLVCNVVYIRSMMNVSLVAGTLLSTSRITSVLYSAITCVENLLDLSVSMIHFFVAWESGD